MYNQFVSTFSKKFSIFRKLEKKEQANYGNDEELEEGDGDDDDDDNNKQNMAILI